jgi:uncharacterized repeat protein (TIGR04138 family)
MRLCEICKEPAAHRVTSARDGQATTAYYCYVHAVERGLLDVPVPLLEQAAADCGYSVNALIFVLESLTRAGHIDDAETPGGGGYTAAAPKTALELCGAVSMAATERFQQQAGLVLHFWNLTRGKDLGAILSGLVRVGALTLAGAGDTQLLQELAMVEGPLVVVA